MADLQKALEQAGFSASQSKALVEHFAAQGHIHGPDTVMVDDDTNLDAWGDGVEGRLTDLELGAVALDEEEDDESDEED